MRPSCDGTPADPGSGSASPELTPDEVHRLLDSTGPKRSEATRLRMAMILAARYSRSPPRTFRELATDFNLPWRRVQRIVFRAEQLLRQPQRRSAWVDLLLRRPETSQSHLYRTLFANTGGTHVRRRRETETTDR